MHFPTAAGIVIYKVRTIRTSVQEGLEYTAEEDIFENIRDYPLVTRIPLLATNPVITDVLFWIFSLLSLNYYRILFIS